MNLTSRYLYFVGQKCSKFSKTVGIAFYWGQKLDGRQSVLPKISTDRNLIHLGKFNYFRFNKVSRSFGIASFRIFRSTTSLEKLTVRIFGTPFLEKLTVRIFGTPFLEKLTVRIFGTTFLEKLTVRVFGTPFLEKLTV